MKKKKKPVKKIKNVIPEFLTSHFPIKALIANELFYIQDYEQLQAILEEGQNGEIL